MKILILEDSLSMFYMYRDMINEELKDYVETIDLVNDVDSFLKKFYDYDFCILDNVLIGESNAVKSITDKLENRKYPMVSCSSDLLNLPSENKNKLMGCIRKSADPLFFNIIIYYINKVINDKEPLNEYPLVKIL